MMNVLTWCLMVMSAFLEVVLTEFGEMEQEGVPGTTVAIFGGETVASTRAEEEERRWVEGKELCG